MRGANKLATKENSENLSPRAQMEIGSALMIDEEFKNPIINLPKQQVQQTAAANINASKQINLKVNIDKDDSDEIKKQYFVRLPHSGFEFDVRGLTVEEEDAIKSAGSSGKRVAQKIMETLYNCISKDVKGEGSPLSTYDSFTKHISVADRDALALAVIEKTYESTHEMTIRCPNCNKSFDEIISLRNCFEYTYYTGEVSIMDKRQELDIDDNDTNTHWKLYFKIPTLADELKVLNTNASSDDLQRAADYIFIDKLEFDDVDDRGMKRHEVVNNYVRIYGLIKKRPAIIRKRILNAYKEFQGDWGVKGSYETSCKYCGSPITMTILPIMHFLELVR